MRKFIAVLLIFLMPITVYAEYVIHPREKIAPHSLYTHTFSGKAVVACESESLIWKIERFVLAGTDCYLTKIWMADPGRQIGKATSDWKQNVLDTEEIAQRAPGASLIINASGYVSPVYRWIPENYPGDNSDYYFTPLGSLTITDGEIFRCLEGVPYYGLTLNKDGLNMHIGKDPHTVLADNPSQTWSFYVECPVITEGRSILDPDWGFTKRPAMRTIIAKVDHNNYIVLTVTRHGGGLTMLECVDFLLENFPLQWAYNLDGGPSSALMYRNEKGRLLSVWKNGQENVDIMTFSLLPEDDSPIVITTNNE